ncbi:cholecystokinin receptor type A-like [Ptychodera flava]|uniref:cholecystokinin receptor type A-like n=1 Tax=Ptychodera flava TaxID=63121 RepID=UPI00396A5B72
MITLGILYTVVCLSGIVGNGVALAVYVRKKTRPTPQYFIIGLAVIDLFVCLVIMPYGIIAVIYPSVLIAELCQLLSWLWHASISSSSFITAAIAVDRYFAVCRPLTFRVSPSYARIVILTSMIVSLLLCSPVIFQFGIAYTPDSNNVTNVTTLMKVCTAIDPGYLGINILSAVIFLALVTLSGLSYGSVYATLRKRSR